MRFVKDYTKVVAIVERARGNETVGQMWLETKTFPKETSIEKIIEWAKDRDCDGKLILTVDESIN